MKLSELITNLQAVQARTENDPTIALKVTDYYTTRYQAHDADFKIDADATIHGGFFINGDWMTIDAHLIANREGKKPKVTFRN